MVFLVNLWLQGDSKIYCRSYLSHNMLSPKSYSGYIAYILFFANLNELILGNTKLWSMFSSLVFAYAIMNFA